MGPRQPRGPAAPGARRRAGRLHGPSDQRGGPAEGRELGCVDPVAARAAGQAAPGAVLDARSRSRICASPGSSTRSAARLVAYTMAGYFGRADRTIWMDGRRQPSEYAEHTWGGFSTGEWVNGTQLKVTTTHMKTSFINRNGIPSSYRGVMTEFITVHDDVMVHLSIVDDPVYLEEPMVRSNNFRRAPGQHVGPAIPVRDRGRTGRSADGLGAALAGGHAAHGVRKPVRPAVRGDARRQGDPVPGVRGHHRGDEAQFSGSRGPGSRRPLRVAGFPLRFGVLYFGLYALVTQLAGGVLLWPGAALPPLGHVWPLRDLTLWLATNVAGLDPAAHLHRQQRRHGLSLGAAGVGAPGGRRIGCGVDHGKPPSRQRRERCTSGSAWASASCSRRRCSITGWRRSSPRSSRPRRS